MSVLWSENPSLTLRHFGVFLLCGVGALGIARQLAPRDLCLVALGVTSILVANGVRTEIALGTFPAVFLGVPFRRHAASEPAGLLLPLMALSAAFLASSAERGRALLWLLCAVAVVLLLLTKSRTACEAFLAGLLAYGWLAASSRNKAIFAAGALSFAGTFVLAAALLGSDFASRAAQRRAARTAGRGRHPHRAHAVVGGTDAARRRAPGSDMAT